MDLRRVVLVLVGQLVLVCGVISSVSSHDCEIGNPLLNREGQEVCCGNHCERRTLCPAQTHECYVEPTNSWSICCQFYERVPRSKYCDIPSQCKQCRPSEQLMILNGKGCPICECTSITPCRLKSCRSNEVCHMITSCEDDLDSCEPEARCTDICELPMDHGTCDGFFLRWYFDSSDGICKKFNYGGCNGNENSFLSKNACLSACGDGRAPRSPLPSSSLPPPSSSSTRPQVPVVGERETNADKEDAPTQVGCPMTSCPSCLTPYELSTFTDAASCQVCRCHLAIKLCENMPCEDHQICVMASPSLCDHPPCEEIPTCMRRPGNPTDSEENDKPNATEKEGEKGEKQEDKGEKDATDRNGIESGRQVKESSCPDLVCNQQCADGEDFIYDTAGCKTCSCVNTTCEMVECATNQICRMVQVHCFTTPCDPMPLCKENENCDTNCKVICEDGEVMATDENGCTLCFCEKNVGVKLTLHSSLVVLLIALYVMS